MKKSGLKSVLDKKYVITTDLNHSYEIPKNFLNRKFTSTKLEEKWVSDITHLRMDKRWY